MRAYVFPGQAARLRTVPSTLVQQNQLVRELFNEAREVFEIDFTTVDLKDELAIRSRDTALAQPLIFLASMTDYLMLPQEQAPDMMAGHSLGHIIALTASGALSLRTALELVRVRATVMQEACIEQVTGMLAVVGLSEDEVRSCCDQWNLERDISQHLVIANYNSPRQFVISGTESGLQHATMKLASATRLVHLASPGGFHSHFMFEANQKLKDHVLSIDLVEPCCPVYLNSTGRCTRSPAEIREELFHHMTSPVRWIDTIQRMIEDGAKEFLQISSGKVLLNLIQEIDNTVSVSNSSTLEDHLHLGNTPEVQARVTFSPEEEVLKSLWVQCNPDLKPRIISTDVNFFDCGADSLDALKLSSAARRQGYQLTIDAINSSRSLSSMALAMERDVKPSGKDENPAEFSLLPKGLNNAATRSQVASLYMPETEIEDIMACSPLQEGLMALSAKAEGTYVTRKALRLGASVDVDRLRSAWSSVIQHTPILRTQIVQLPNGQFVQVICRTESLWSEDQYDGRNPMGLGTWLVHLGIENNPDQNDRDLVITLHHAIFDAWSLHLVLEAVETAYHGEQIPKQVSFARFIAHVIDKQPEEAMSHWKEVLSEVEAPQFPKLPVSTHQPHADHQVVHTIRCLSWNRKFATPSNTVRAAFGLLVSRLTGSADIVFGSTVFGRQLEDLPGSEDIAGPMIATVPTRMLVDMEVTAADFLDKVQCQTHASMPFVHLGLSQISKINGDTRAACAFQSLLVMQNLPSRQQTRDWTVFPDGIRNLPVTKGALGNFSNYALVVECTVMQDGLRVHIEYDGAVIDKASVDRMTHQLEHCIRQLNDPMNSHLQLEDIPWTSQQDMNSILEWNNVSFPSVEASVHSLFAKTATKLPSAQAVCAWDGSLTYSELDNLSSRLALYLVSKGMGTGPKGLSAVSPFYLEKGVWAVVVALAVMKAGGAGCFLDGNLPEDRLNSIAGQLAPSLVLSSQDRLQEAKRAWTGRCEILLIDQALFDNLAPLPGRYTLPPVEPSDPICALFTSGSTGTPKGILLSHSQVCAAIRYHATGMNFSETTRYYDFSAQAFDAAWHGITEVLAAGGCLCVPSDADRRNDLAGSFTRLGANSTMITPSVARTLVPETVPGLKTLVLGGEAINSNDVAQWSHVPHFMGAYGPAECVFYSTMVRLNGPHLEPEDHIRFPNGILGSGSVCGATMWLVDPSARQLAPLGGLGEIWIEGPKVGDAYFGNEAATRKAFHNCPVWLNADIRGRLKRELHRFYRTGDLASYDSHGRLVFMGHRDLQVKINGQRIELDEIQLRADQSMKSSGIKNPSLRDIKLHINVIAPRGCPKKVLVAFLAAPGDLEQDTDMRTMSPTPLLAEVSGLITRSLRRKFPDYMVPSIFIPVNKIPMSATGKTDHRLLREFGSSLSMEQLIQLNPLRQGRTAPQTRAEIALSKLWAETLQLDPEAISTHDSFYQLGGDSIAAMGLVARARSQGHTLAALDIMQNPVLCDQATKLTVENGQAEEAGPPAAFSLMRAESTKDLDELIERAAAICELDRTAVQDIYPCTPLQEALMAATVRDPTKYVGKMVYELDSAVDSSQLLRAFEVAHSEIDVMRARIIDAGEAGLLQVITSATCSTHRWDSLGEYQRAERPVFGLGTALFRLDLLHESPEPASRRFLVLSIHHAVYDGWSLPLILDRVGSLYAASNLSSEPAPPFSIFAQHVQSVDVESARQFWQDHLNNTEATTFPHVPRPAYEPLVQDSFSQRVDNIAWPGVGTDLTLSTLLTTAWAAVASRYSDSADVVFGLVSNGRMAPVQRIESISGLTIATVPMRVHIPSTSTLSDVLSKVQETSTAMIPYEQVGIRAIKHSGAEAERLCQFQTLLIVQPSADRKTASESEHLLRVPKTQDQVVQELCHDTGAFGSHALCIQIFPDNSGCTLKVTHDPEVVSERSARRLIRQFGVVVRQIISSLRLGRDIKVAQLSLHNEEDELQIWRWNSQVPELVQGCVHDLVREAARTYPESPAVCSWEGSLTHRELDELSTRLAVFLAHLGVGSGTIVPLCFEKSLWTVVAIMGVMKAGGASVTMDVGQPVERLRQIVAKANPIVVLCSANRTDLATNLVAPLSSKPHVHPVSEQALANLDPNPAACSVLPDVDPTSPLYIVFTSGSTGEPKGAVVSHANFCSAIRYQREAMRYHPGSRVFDFVSYAFDVTWPNILQTLTVGGCVCVPSEDERKNDISASIKRLKANAIHVPTSVARLVDPAVLPDIETVVVGGEPVTLPDVTRWGPNVEVIQVYGPAECTPPIMASYNVHSEASMRNIGHGYGVVLWIVDPEDPQTLSPLGVVGELVVEGPLIGLGYLNEPQKTAVPFLDDPKWLIDGAPGHTGRHGRVYRTGDLARYDEDGSIVFIGRKDSQVKVRGQRVEMGEVEFQIARLLELHNQPAEVIVDVVQPKDSTIVVLVAFVAIGPAASDTKEKAITALQGIVASLEGLSDVLPIYMVPMAYLPLERFPIGGTGKIDHRRLRGIGAALTMEELTSYNPDGQDKRQPSTEWERRFRDLAAQVLAIDPGSIGADDSFLRLGGDSITAIRMVGLMRKKYGLGVTVADILSKPRLSELALLAADRLSESKEEMSESDVKPFRLLEEGVDVDKVKSLAATDLGLAECLIEDIYPCTPLQEGLLASTALVSDSYMAHSQFRLAPSVDVERLRRSWDALVRQTPILRTRIVELPKYGLVQVVLAEDSQQWVEETDLPGDEPSSQQVGLGLPLLRCGFKSLPSGSTVFWWDMHHALYDGVTLRLLVDYLCKAYKEAELPAITPYNRFIAYVDGVSGVTGANTDAVTFWEHQLDRIDVLPFPSLPTPSYRPKSDAVHERLVTGITWPRSDLTAPNILRAIWALLCARHSASDATIFGVVVSGRQAPLTGIENVVGPTLATVPVLVPVFEESSLLSFLQDVQSQAVSMIPFEQTGLHRIHRMSPRLEKQSRFNTLLICQLEYEDDEATLDCPLWRDCSAEEAPSANQRSSRSSAFTSYAMFVQFTLVRDGLRLKFDFDSDVVSKQSVQWMAEQFESGLRRVVSVDPANTRVKDISFLCQRDLDTIWGLNTKVPVPDNRCIHELIRQVSTEWPDRLAVDAHDGKITYKDLESATNSFARLLVSKGVSSRTIVPLLFEKSLWTTVAAIGTMKAGATVVLLDPFLPVERLATIVSQIQAPLIVSSVEFSNIAGQLPVGETIVLPKALPDNGDCGSVGDLPKVSPSDAAYIVFTSGSTGTPKGVVIRHTNITSSIRHQSKALGFADASRVFDFASYSFDVCWSNMLQTLAAGACLCVPSESERRNDLQGALVRFKVDTVELTPSVARTLHVESLSSSLPGLKLLHLGGEAVTAGDVATWLNVPGLTVINGYGPSEATPTTVAHVLTERDLHEPLIGTGLGVCCWVVDISDSGRLAPVGSIGELWLEGPLVGAGYLNDADKTAASFVVDPPWLVNGYSRPGRSVPGRSARPYRTGDLVKLAPDGQLVYVGRMDAQVKINGQRTELNEIESIIRENLPEGSGLTVVVDMLPSPSDTNDSNTKMLVAFVALSQSAEEEEPDSKRKLLTVRITELDRKLALVLPRYMIPSVFLAIDSIPLGATGKTDRRQLRRIAQSMDREAWRAADLLRARRDEDNAVAAANMVPQTATQKVIRKLWAELLGLDAEAIGLGDSFFRLGGDSVLAMRLVGRARLHKLRLDVAQIFRHPELEVLANSVDEAEGLETRAGTVCIAGQEDKSLLPPAPFSLLNLDAPSLSRTLEEAASALGVSVDEIEDMYPCTALQEGFLAITEQQTGKYIAQYHYQLPPDVDLNRFKAAWQAVASPMPILRTRFAELNEQGTIQVVLATGEELHEYQDWEERSRRDGQLQRIGLGGSSARYEIIHPSPGSPHGPIFIWTLHHCIYDGWSLSMYLDAVQSTYNDQVLAAVPDSTPFNVFIRHLCLADQQAATDFWRQEFESSQAFAYPKLPSATYQVNPTSKYRHGIEGLSLKRRQFTPSTYLQAAWSILASRHSNSEEIIFGSVSSGRQASLPDITNVAGPTVATVPVRAEVNGTETVSDFLRKVQEHNLALVHFEQVGLQKIRRLGGGLGTKSVFNTLLVMQLDMDVARGVNKNEGDQLFGHDLNVYAADHVQQPGEAYRQQPQTQVDEFAFSSYAITLLLTTSKEGVEIEFFFDNGVVEHDMVERISLQFETLLRQLCDEEAGDATLATLSATSARDLEDIWSWNSAVPPDIEKCIHHMVADNVAAKGLQNALAVQAHDGQYTYAELDSMSDKLAVALIAAGHGTVGPNVVIPLFFEKSKWTVVSILAAWKTGAAVLTLDDNLQDDQIRGMIDQISPTFVVASARRESRCRRILDMEPTMRLPITVVDEAFISSQPNPGREQALQLSTGSGVQPSDLLYVNFTSGSTGKPKGVMVRHCNFAAASTYQAAAFGFSETSRVYDFGAYAFDITWLNLIFTLTVGGSLCIPTDDQRRDDLVGSFRQLGANLINLTPSVSRTIDPASMVGLKTLAFCGEPVLGTDVAQWLKKGPQTRLINTYGPSECTTATTAHVLTEEDETAPATRFGVGLGLNTWLIEPDGSGVAAVGSVGELWLEGPLVSAGYINDPVKTAASFVENPRWLAQGAPGHAGRSGRLYRTGDLVRYNTDRTLSYVSRVDTQVKIGGHRVGLAEIEFVAQQVLDSASVADSEADKQVDADVASSVSQGTQMRVTVDLVRPAGGDTKLLVAFIAAQTDSHDRGSGSGAVTTTASDKQRVADWLSVSDFKAAMAQHLPLALVPRVFIPVETMPVNNSGKIDRRRLSAPLNTMSVQEVLRLDGTRTPVPALKQAPETQNEVTLAYIWSKVLSIPEDRIGVEDSFIQLGGDSILAMKVVGVARQHQLVLRAAQVIATPVLRDQAELLRPREPASKAAAEGATPVPRQGLVSNMSAFASRPATMFQTLCVDAARHSPPAWYGFCIMDLPPSSPTLGSGPEAGIRLCEWLWTTFDILRAVFLPLSPGKKSTGYTMEFAPAAETPLAPVRLLGVEDDLEAVTREVRDNEGYGPLVLGQPFVRFWVLHQAELPDVPLTRIMMRLPHAQHDGISLDRMLLQVAAYAQGGRVERPLHFDHYLAAADRARRQGVEHWRRLLRGATMTRPGGSQGQGQSQPAPPAPLSAARAGMRSLAVPSIRGRLPNWPPGGVKLATPATVFTAICARTIARVVGARDVVFGRLVAGRASAISGAAADDAMAAEGGDGAGGVVASVAGPCINFVPVRVDDAAQSRDIVDVIQSQLVQGMEYEGVGLHEIGSGSESGFGFTVQYQNHQNMRQDGPASPAGPGVRFGWRHGQAEDRDEALFGDCIAIRAEPAEPKGVDSECVGGHVGQDGWDFIVSGPEERISVMERVAEEIVRIAAGGIESA